MPTVENTTATEATATAAEATAATKAPVKKKADKKAAPKATAKKAVEPKAEAKKAPKKAAKTEAVQGEFGATRSHDLPWNDKKVVVFKALKACKAVTKDAAVTAATVVERAAKMNLELTARDVRHYCYHAAAAGLVSVDKVEGQAGYSFSLTKKGAEIDPTKEMKSAQTN